MDNSSTPLRNVPPHESSLEHDEDDLKMGAETLQTYHLNPTTYRSLEISHGEYIDEPDVLQRSAYKSMDLQMMSSVPQQPGLAPKSLELGGNYETLSFHSESLSRWESEPAPVAEQPEWLEQSTSFISNHFPGHILASMANALTELNVQHTLHLSSNKIDGNVVQSCEKINFEVQVYKSASGSDQYVVECHRFNGCGFAFFDFYVNLVVNLGDIVASTFAGRSIQELLEEKTQRDQRNAKFHLSLESLGDLDGVVDMAGSDCLDVAREGMLALAQLSSDPDNVALMSQSKQICSLARSRQDLDDLSALLCGNLEACK